MVARKRWGRGRTRQLVAGVWCWLAGHRWGEPYYDSGIVLHRCQRGCGGLHVGIHLRGRRPS